MEGAGRMNMRGVQVQVPEQAKQRVEELTLARDLALDQTKALQARINMLDGSPQLAERLVSERDKQALRANHLQRLVSSCNQFLMQLRLAPGTTLEVHPPLNLTIRTSLPKAVESTREQIADLQKEIARVRSAPLKVSSKRDAARAYLERLAQVYAPKIVFDGRGNAKATWTEEIVTSRDQILALIVWALGPNGPAELVEAFQIDEEPEPEEALSPEEKAAAISKFSSTLLQLERQENSLISCAAADGHEITRRPDASPLAVLNLVIVQQEPQQQVA
jgi:vancomycin resistance protein YoaR